MPGPTWRNIAAPDLSASLAAISAASNNFNQGFAVAKQGVKEFDDAETARMNAAFQTALLGQQDSGKFSEALAADPTLGFDPRRLNAQSLAMASNWTNTLLGQDRTRQSLEAGAEDLTQSRWNFSEKKDGVERGKAMGELWSQSMPLVAKGDTAGAVSAFQQMAAGKGFRGDEVSGFIKDVLGFEKTNIDMTGQRQDQRFQAENQGWSREDRESGKAADAITEAVLSQAGPGSNILALVEQASAGANPTVRAAVRAKVDAALGTSLFSGMGAGGGAGVGGGGGSSGGGGDAYNTIVGYGKYGSPDKPLSQMTMGEVYDFGRSVLIPNTKKAGLGRDRRGLIGTSAVGAYQITGETMAGYAKQKYGPDWRNMVFSPEMQDEIGEHLFHANKHKNLKETWQGLKDTRPGAYAGKSWSEMKRIIMQDEGTGGGLSPTEAKRMAERGVDSNSTDLDVQSWANGIGKNAPTITVAQAISKQIPGSKPKELMVIIDRMVDASRGPDKKPRLNRTQAGQIVIESMTPDTAGSFQKTLDSWGLGNDNPALSGGWRLDQGKVGAKVKAALQGDQAFIVNDNERRMGEAQNVAKAQAEYEALAQQENAIRRDVAAGRAGRASLLPEIIMQKNVAYAAWKQAEEPLLERERRSRGEPPKGTPPKKTTAKAPPKKPKAEPRSVFSLGDWFTLKSN